MTTNDEGWFYLPINKGQWGDVFVKESFYNNGGVYIGDRNADWWMGNDHTYMNGVAGLKSQCINATGRVLLGGLGLGLLTLLLAEKKEVTEVVVVELNPNTVEAFRSNGWDESKIKIVVSSITDYKDTEGFDWILLDHVNQEAGLELYYLYQRHLPQIISNVGEPRIGVDVFTWEELYLRWLDRRPHTIESYYQFAKPLRLPEYSDDEVKSYVELYDFCSMGETTKVDMVLSDALAQVYNNRKRA
jgi:hypothetical protein